VIFLKKQKNYVSGNRAEKNLDHCILISHSLFLNRPEDAIQQNRKVGGLVRYLKRKSVVRRKSVKRPPNKKSCRP